MFWQYCYLGTVAVVWVISLTQIHRYKLPVKLLSVVLFVALFIDASGYWLSNHNINNQFLYHIYNPVEYSVLSYLYASAFSNCKIKALTLISALLFALFCCYNTLFIQSVTLSPTVAFVVEWTLILLLVLRYFYELYTSDSLILIKSQLLFWISLGNFFFYAGTFFLMGLIQEINKRDVELASQLFLVNTFLNIVMYSLWGVGFLCNRPYQTLSSSSSSVL